MGRNSLQIIKNKLNTESSIEAEVVKINDYVPLNTSIHLFMEAHVYPLKSNVVYQHNQSATFMERNGQVSCNENSCHIHFRYLFVEDRQYKGEFSIGYRPAWKGLAKYFKNSLQERIFNLTEKLSSDGNMSVRHITHTTWTHVAFILNGICDWGKNI